MRTCSAIALLAAICALPHGQELIAQQTSFSSNQKSITIERFDPPGKHSRAVVMLVHGAGGPQGGWRSSGMLETLTHAGYSVFVPHYFEIADWDRSRAEELFPIYIQTLRDALLHIAQQPDVDTQRGIGLVGFSLGGYLVLGLPVARGAQTASKMKIKAVVELYGALPAAATDHVAQMPPILILHGAKDESVPVKNAYELDSVLTRNKVPHQIKIYADQGHGFRGEALKDSNQRTVSFLKRYLQ